MKEIISQLFELSLPIPTYKKERKKENLSVKGGQQQKGAAAAATTTAPRARELGVNEKKRER